MTNPEIERIALENNLFYEYAEEQTKHLLSNKMPIMHHMMSLDYEDRPIDLHFEFGFTNMGTARCVIPFIYNKDHFSINKKNTFKLLFRKTENNVFKISCDNKSNLIKIESLLLSSGLSKIAKDTNFSPKIKFENKGGHTEVTTQFYLGFQHKELAIPPIFDFYKLLIDWANQLN